MADPLHDDLDEDLSGIDDAMGLPEGLVRQVLDALDENDTARIEELVQPLHYADTADLLEQLGHGDRRLVVAILKPMLDPASIAELDEAVRGEVLDLLDTEEVASVITELDSDDAVELIADLEPEAQQELLSAVSASERVMLEQGLAYPEDSAGRMMQRDVVAVPSYWTVGEVIDHLRSAEELPDDFYDLFVVDPKYRPIGTIPLSRVLRTVRSVPVGEIMETDRELRTVPAATDQEEVAHLFRQQNLISAPVVDSDGRLTGVITVDDVVDVIDEEHEEDLMRLAGVSEADTFRAVIDTTQKRFAWLLVNLGTAILASLVIGAFAETIEQAVALAVLMPIVASMGGNAGTQTLTVAVRALAMKELTPANATRVIIKEVIVGGINGILFAVIAAAVAGLWFQDLNLALVMAIAMVVTMVVAGLAGTAIPLGLALRGIDPAVASAVFLTTVTDVVGFFAFLGLASWVLL
ncbi:MAG: magnesium transporter [Rhodospirillaceae bacterium]|jgi:magnesium transporter|nr:magnesium transporter [Rhodospirillaceae bacterium]